jgi:hypothetical protein
VYLLNNINSDDSVYVFLCSQQIHGINVDFKENYCSIPQENISLKGQFFKKNRFPDYFIKWKYIYKYTNFK